MHNPAFPNELQTEFASTAVALRYANGECDAEQLKACFDRVACRPNFGNEGLPLFLKWLFCLRKKISNCVSPVVQQRQQKKKKKENKKKENNNEQDSMKSVPTDFVK